MSQNYEKCTKMRLWLHEERRESCWGIRNPYDENHEEIKRPRNEKIRKRPSVTKIRKIGLEKQILESWNKRRRSKEKRRSLKRRQNRVENQGKDKDAIKDKDNRSKREERRRSRISRRWRRFIKASEPNAGMKLERRQKIFGK